MDAPTRRPSPPGSICASCRCNGRARFCRPWQTSRLNAPLQANAETSLSGLDEDQPGSSRTLAASAGWVASAHASLAELGHSLHKRATVWAFHCNIHGDPTHDPTHEAGFRFASHAPTPTSAFASKRRTRLRAPSAVLAVQDLG